MTDDASLLSHFVSTRSESAFATLVERHMSLVYYSALRQLGGDAHRAQDAAQEVFVLLARKAPALRGHPSLAGWLHASTHFAVSAMRRGDRRRLQREQVVESMQDHVAPARAGSDWDTLAPVLDQALLELPEKDREAILLRFFQDRAYAEIGVRLAVNEGAAQKRVQRALEKLRAVLARRGATSTAALAALLSSQVGMAAPPALTAAVTTAAFAAAGPAIPAASIFSLMSTAKFSTGIAAIAVLVALGGAAYEIKADRRAQAVLASAAQAQAALANRVRGLDERALAAQRQGAVLPPHPASSAGPGGAEAGPSAGADPFAAGRTFLKAHPDVAEALVSRSRARALSRYGPLFASLGLSPAQVGQFEDIIMQGEGWGSNNATGMILPIGPTQASGDPTIQSQLQAFLGDASYAQYRQFVRLMPARELTTQLAGTLYFTDTPLTGSEAAQLQQAFADAQAAGLKGAQLNENLLQKAQASLAPPQFAALTGLFTQQRFQAALSQAFAQARGAAGDPSK